MARIAALPVAAFFLSLSLAGCFASPEGPEESPAGPDVWTADDPRLSQPIYEKLTVEHVLVPSFDGKRMDNWVFRPQTPENVTVSVFINFSPYWSNLAPDASTGGDAFSQYMIEYFAPRGYAIVLSSARGTGYSEGCFNLGGSVEQRDAATVIEYFAAQGWSNGNVGAGGKSYDGTIPNGVAVLAPPALKTIIPVSPISELYKYNYKDGLSYIHGWRFNQYYYAGVGMDVQYGQPKTDRLDLLLDDVNCPYLPEMQAWGLASGLVGDSSDYWDERNYTRDASKATAAMWLIHGLQDWNVKPDNILPWLNEYGGPVKAWLHQWTDGGTGGHVYPMRADWNLTMLRWLDHWLKGIETGIMDEPAVQVQSVGGQWRNEASWPPADVRYQTLEVQVPVPLRAGSPARVVVSGHELAYNETGADVGYHVAGEIELVLRVSTDRPEGRVIAYLHDADSGDLITFGGLNLRHREGIQDPQPVTPLEEYDVRFKLHPADFPRGSHSSMMLTLGLEGQHYFLPPSAATVTVHGPVQVILPVKSEPLRPEMPAPTEFDSCWAC